MLHITFIEFIFFHEKSKHTTSMRAAYLSARGYFQVHQAYFAVNQQLTSLLEQQQWQHPSEIYNCVKFNSTTIAACPNHPQNIQQMKTQLIGFPHYLNSLSNKIVASLRCRQHKWKRESLTKVVANSKIINWV